ncbi:MAG: class I tRNA ligase family protein, partial [Desulfovibrio sp.]|nr:class I tRNA ligase family protein [Desulfovibrio sp.]
EKGKAAVVAELEKQGKGEANIQYRLRDWNISRQRYWGAPIPVVYCEKCGVVPEKEENLPVKLPLDAKLLDDGRSPLPYDESFVSCSCPRCGSPAKRETDTMDTFMESSWYFARYTSPREDKGPFDPEALEYWMPVDQYIGGVEHAILHLLYSRFFTRALRDMGVYPKNLSEPFTRLLTQGMVLKDGAKMSKSRGNVVDPAAMIAKYGADTTRLFCLFGAPPERDFDWSDTGIEGSWRFLNRVWRLFQDESARIIPLRSGEASNEDAKSPLAREIRRKEHATIKKAAADLAEKFQFNTGIAQLMELTNFLYGIREKLGDNEADNRAFSSALATLLTLLFPVAPHIASELWSRMGHETDISREAWPAHDEGALAEEEISIVAQINGKLRGSIVVPADAGREAIEAAALNDPALKKFLDGKEIKKTIVVPGKLINIVAK